MRASTTETQHSPEIEFEHDDFILGSIEEEIRVDASCQALLEQFYQHLLKIGYNLELASDLAFCADYYLRDYLVDFARQNVVRPQPGIVRCFAATWYITRTLDPDFVVLERYLEGIRRFYRFLNNKHLVSKEELTFIEDEIGQTDYYRHRIETFLAVSGDGYTDWLAECPLNV